MHKQFKFTTKAQSFFLKDRRVKNTKEVYLNHLRDRNKIGSFSLEFST